MTTGAIRQVNIGQEMRDAYLDYAMSVIVARALPDARDGLKPVHRRILYAMYDMGLRPDSAFKKSARIVGEVLGKYHPHGDQAIYESLVRMAQEFSMRHPLIEGQGNFGSIDGDGAAAMRYTEARMARIGGELLADIDKDTVDFTDNFDGTLREPSVLPAALPNLLVNGSSGIAVGMSTNIPPHNLGEVIDALVYMLGRWDELDEVTVQDLMQFIKGPDFPTGGLVYHHSDDQSEEGSLVTAYATGRGKITMRAKVHIEEMGRGKSRIIVSELPYQVNKSALVERIATLVRDNKLEGIADLRDESDRQGLRLAIELQRGAEPEAVLRRLFQLTPLQETFSIILLALVNNEPRTLSLKQALRVYLDHRLEVVRRRSEYDLARARERAHILEGLLKAIDALDAVIQTIRQSENAEAARAALMALLDCTEIQARAILDLQLRRLAALERLQIQEEYRQKRELIAYLEGLLADPAQMRALIADELRAIKAEYSEPRRTIIVGDTASASISAALLVPDEETWITLTTANTLARTYEPVPPRVTVDVKEPPRFVLQATTSQILYFFTADGMCATLPVHQVPQAHTPAEGSPLRDLTPFKNGEVIAAVVALSPDADAGMLVFVTQRGEVKRLRVEDLPGMRADAFEVMDVEPGDALGWVLLTTGHEEIILVTMHGQAIRFKESDVRPTGMGAGGMRGIKLSTEEKAVAGGVLRQIDRVVGAGIACDELVLWTITDTGFAKYTPLSEYPTQGRAGSGVIAMKLPGEAGLAAAVTGTPTDEVIILTSKGRPKQVKLSHAPLAKRSGKGDNVIAVWNKEFVAGVVVFQSLRAPAGAPSLTAEASETNALVD